MECRLEVWKLSHELTLRVYEVTKQLPSNGNFGLTSQLRRSVVSVCQQILLKTVVGNIKRSLFNFYILRKVR